MVKLNELQPIDRPALIKRMLIGWAIALVLITLFLAGGHPNPEWPKYWIIKPLIITPLSGAAGGAFLYFMEYISYGGGWKRVVAIIAGVLVCLIGFWMGFVLGLNGTYWD